ncbi:MAG: hypothetical protein DDT19_01047 [Syntrophomonadaceae bacterium]|nr:hypothetical protein [Bacillota bacterium]
MGYLRDREIAKQKRAQPNAVSLLYEKSGAKERAHKEIQKMGEVLKGAFARMGEEIASVFKTELPKNIKDAIQKEQEPDKRKRMWATLNSLFMFSKDELNGLSGLYQSFLTSDLLFTQKKTEVDRFEGKDVKSLISRSAYLAEVMSVFTDPAQMKLVRNRIHEDLEMRFSSDVADEIMTNHMNMGIKMVKDGKGKVEGFKIFENLFTPAILKFRADYLDSSEEGKIKDNKKNELCIEIKRLKDKLGIQNNEVVKLLENINEKLVATMQLPPSLNQSFSESLGKIKSAFIESCEEVVEVKVVEDERSLELGKENTAKKKDEPIPFWASKNAEVVSGLSATQFVKQDRVR